MEANNVMAMRKALIAAKGNLDSMGANALEGELNLDAVAMICARMSARIEAALSAPARNCDRFTSGPEAVGAYHRRLPPRFLRNAEEYDDIHDFAAWLYAEKKD